MLPLHFNFKALSLLRGKNGILDEKFLSNINLNELDSRTKPLDDIICPLPRILRNECLSYDVTETCTAEYYQ